MRSFAAAFAGGIVSTVFTTMLVLAWTGPTSAPPSGNVAAPINVGSTAQVKNGGLSVNTLAVFGNAMLSGTSRILNFGTGIGESGYGIRDNAGTMQFKNGGGAWSNVDQVGLLMNGSWCTSDGTTVNCTSAAPTSTPTQVTASCSTSSGTCTVSCPAGYVRSGCSASGVSTISFSGGGSPGAAAGAVPNGTNACRCTHATGSGAAATCYAYCIK